MLKLEGHSLTVTGLDLSDAEGLIASGAPQAGRVPRATDRRSRKAAAVVLSLKAGYRRRQWIEHSTPRRPGRITRCSFGSV